MTPPFTALNRSMQTTGHPVPPPVLRISLRPSPPAGKKMYCFQQNLVSRRGF